MDWNFELESTFQRPLNRQLNEVVRIRRARIGGILVEVSKDLYNTKNEWHSHVTEWDLV